MWIGRDLAAVIGQKAFTPVGGNSSPAQRSRNHRARTTRHKLIPGVREQLR